jgi:mono/diheme cytochrome c family protein
LRAVVADPAASADSAWINLPSQAAPALADALEKRGYEVFQQRCVACHGPIPTEIFGAPFLPAMPGTQALQARYRGEIPAVLEERTNLTEALVQAVVRKGLNSMPPFRPTEVSNEDLAAVSAYLTRTRN